MQPSPSALTDEREEQSAVCSLALQIEEAVAQADANRVRHLSFTRHHLLRKACGPDGSVRFSDTRRAELIRESENLIARMYEQQNRIVAEIERLRARRNTKLILTRAYRAAPATVAQCFTHRG